MNHFAVKCCSSAPISVRPVTSTESPADKEIFQTQTTNTGVDDLHLVTIQLDSGSHIRFQVDIGAQCNVVPLNIYNNGTPDHTFSQASSSRAKITAYGGTTLPVVGSVLLRVWRGDYHCLLDCKLVDHTDIRLLLGRKACRGMGIVSYLDNHFPNKPETGSGQSIP